MSSPLSERHHRFLAAVIEHHLAEATPIGSKTLVAETGTRLSPASIRTVLGGLERAGFIRRPHASSGRVPTPDGYRYYVAHLMPRRELTAAERRTLQERIDEDRAPQALADLVARELGQLALAVERSGGRYRAVYGGAGHLAAQPEFRRSDQLASILAWLDERRRVAKQVADLPGDPLTVAIGSELGIDEMNGCAVVSVRLDDADAHAVAVLGPIRMDYAAITARLMAVRELWNERHATS